MKIITLIYRSDLPFRKGGIYMTYEEIKKNEEVLAYLKKEMMC